MMNATNIQLIIFICDNQLHHIQLILSQSNQENNINYIYKLKNIFNSKQYISYQGIQQIENPIHLVGSSKFTKFLKGENDGGIKETVTKYFQEGYPDKIPYKKKNHSLYNTYSQHQFIEDGFQLLFFQGEEVEQVIYLPNEFTHTIIPSGRCAKLTIGPGKMPQICIQAWDEVVTWSDERLGGQRAREIEFEIYDERAKDENDATFDMYIQLK